MFFLRPNSPADGAAPRRERDGFHQSSRRLLIRERRVPLLRGHRELPVQDGSAHLDRPVNGRVRGGPELVNFRHAQMEAVLGPDPVEPPAEPLEHILTQPVPLPGLEGRLLGGPVAFDRDDLVAQVGPIGRFLRRTTLRENEA